MNWKKALAGSRSEQVGDSQEEMKSGVKHFIFAVMNCLMNMIFHKGRVCAMLLKQQMCSHTSHSHAFFIVNVNVAGRTWRSLLSLTSTHYSQCTRQVTITISILNVFKGQLN